MQNFFFALRIRAFLFLWLAEFFSQIAMNMMNFILILIAYSLTNSNTAVSGIILSFTIPAIIFGILAGVYVDRWNKKYVLILTNVIRFFILFVLALLHANLFMLYGLSFLGSIVTQFFIPAESPMIPVLVPKEYLLSANALFSMALFGSVLVAYGLSGPFLIFFGSSNALFILAGVFLVAGICALLIKVPKNKNPHKHLVIKLGFIGEIRKALSAILKLRDVTHAFSLLVFSQVFTLIIAVLGPGYARDILRININQFPLLFVFPSAIGMGVGSYLVTNFFNHRSRHKIANLGLFVGAITILFMPHAQVFGNSIFYVMVFLAFLLGISNALMFVPSNTLLLEHTTEEVRGKIYGALNSFVAVVSLVPVVVAGGLADLFGVGNVLTFVGVIIGVIGVLRMTL